MGREDGGRIEFGSAGDCGVMGLKGDLSFFASSLFLSGYFLGMSAASARWLGVFFFLFLSAVWGFCAYKQWVILMDPPMTR